MRTRIDNSTAIAIADLYYRTYRVPHTHEQIDSIRISEMLYIQRLPRQVIQKVRTLNTRTSLTQWIMDLPSGLAVSHLTLSNYVDPSTIHPTSEQMLEGNKILLVMASVITTQLIENHDKGKDGHSRREAVQDDFHIMITALEENQYKYDESRLEYVDSDTELVEPEEELQLLTQLYKDSGFPNYQSNHKIVKKGIEHYSNGNWKESITQWRRVLDNVQKEIAKDISSHRRDLTAQDWSKAARVREFIERSGMYTEHERNLMHHLYGFASEYGPHESVARKEHARLTRNTVLTMCQYILERYQTFRKNGYKETKSATT